MLSLYLGFFACFFLVAGINAAAINNNLVKFEYPECDNLTVSANNLEARTEFLATLSPQDRNLVNENIDYIHWFCIVNHYKTIFSFQDISNLVTACYQCSLEISIEINKEQFDFERMKTMRCIFKKLETIIGKKIVRPDNSVDVEIFKKYWCILTLDNELPEAAPWIVAEIEGCENEKGETPDESLDKVQRCFETKFADGLNRRLFKA